MAAESIAMLPYTISSSIPLDHHRLLPRVLSVSSSHSAAHSRNCSSSSSAAAQSSPLLSLRKCLPPLKALVTADTARTANTTPLGVDDRVGVLLLNLGEPETLDDVQPFLFNLFADPANETIYLIQSSYYYMGNLRLCSEVSLQPEITG